MFVPLFGPSSPRDLAGQGVDIVINPLTWLGQGAVVDAAGLDALGLTVVDTREALLEPIDQVRATSLDPYSTIRSAYRQRRAFEIRNQEGPAGRVVGPSGVHRLRPGRDRPGGPDAAPPRGPRDDSESTWNDPYDPMKRRLLLASPAPRPRRCPAPRPGRRRDRPRPRHHLRARCRQRPGRAPSTTSGWTWRRGATRSPPCCAARSTSRAPAASSSAATCARRARRNWPEYNRLFDDIIVRNLSARFGEYRGVRFSLGRSQQRTEEDVLVNTIIERPNQPAFSLDWRVAEVGGQPRVVDVIAEGTSLRLTTRSEYSAVIQRNGGRVASLLEAMRNQIAQLAARETRS